MVTSWDWMSLPPGRPFPYLRLCRDASGRDVATAPQVWIGKALACSVNMTRRRWLTAASCDDGKVEVGWERDILLPGRCQQRGPFILGREYRICNVPARE